MKCLYLPLALFIVSGCSTVGNYKQLENGDYLISIYSNAFSSYKKVQAKLHEKSTKACGGEYHVMEYKPSEIKTIKTYDAHNTSANVLNTQRVIRCGAAQNGGQKTLPET